MFGTRKTKARRDTFLIRATARLRQVMGIVKQERRRLGNISDESLLYLIALIREGSGVGFHVLINFTNKPNDLYEKVKNGLCEEGMSASNCPSRARDEYFLAAVDASKNLGDKYVGTEHLLLGLLSEDGKAGRILKEHGLGFESAKEAIFKVRIDASKQAEHADPKGRPKGRP